MTWNSIAKTQLFEITELFCSKTKIEPLINAPQAATGHYEFYLKLRSASKVTSS